MILSTPQMIVNIPNCLHMSKSNGEFSVHVISNLSAVSDTGSDFHLLKTLPSNGFQDTKPLGPFPHQQVILLSLHGWSSSPRHPINVGKGPRPYPGLWFQITSRADDAHISLQGRPPGSMLSMSTVMANHHFQLLISHICLSWSPHSGRKMAIPLFHWNISLNSAWRICTAQAQNLSSLARLLSGKCPLSWVTPSASVLQNCPSQKNKQNTPLSSPPDGAPISQLPL